MPCLAGKPENFSRDISIFVMLVLVSWPYGRCITQKLCTFGKFLSTCNIVRTSFWGDNALFTAKESEFA